MTLFRLWFPILFFSLIIGCVKPDREADTQMDKSFDKNGRLTDYNSGAFFEGGDIVPKNMQFYFNGQKVKDGEWKQVNQARIWFEICGLKDRATRGTIRNERFHISSQLGDEINEADTDNTILQQTNPISVNQNHCLKFSQFIPDFNFLANSYNLVLHYKIESLAGGLGTMVRRVIFNPWEVYRNNGKMNGVFDYSDYDSSEWPEGERLVEAEDIRNALMGRGKFKNVDAQLFLSGLVVEPIQREKERIAQYNDILDGLSPEEKKERQKLDKLMLKQTGYHINLNMRSNLMVRLKDVGGVPHDVPINSGRFRVFMNLVCDGCNESTEKYLLSSNLAQVTGRTGSAFSWDVDQNGLQVSYPLLLNRNTQKGRVSLLLMVVPEDSTFEGMKPFVGQMDLGNFNSWFGKTGPMFKFDENFKPMSEVNYDKFMKTLEEAKVPKKLATLRDQKRYYFGPLKMRFVRIMPGESATDRTLMYSVYSCVRHGAYGYRVGRGLQFEVTTDDKVRGTHTMKRATNEDGCLTWFGFLSHKYYRKEVLEKKTSIVKYVGTLSCEKLESENKDEVETARIREQCRAEKADDQSGVNKNGERNILNTYKHSFTYYMNPWDEKWTFGWDEPDMPINYPQQIAEERKTAPVSKLFIADFKYTTMGFRYSIDKYLNLKVKKAVLLQAYPYVLKYNSIVRGRLGTEKLRDGVYLMKVALQKDYLDPAAKGVRIYDEKLKNPIYLADTRNAENFVLDRQFMDNINPEDYLTEEELKNLDEDERMELARERVSYQDAFPNAFDRFKELDPSAGGSKGTAAMTYAPDGRSGDHIDHELIEATDLREDKKEFISTQTKLVRVLGGMIITPIEFEVDDLRLMRIRNQFFIQLQTIDEHKLRYATMIDQTFKDMNLDGYIEERYEELFKALDKIDDIESEIARLKLDQIEDGELKKKAENDLRLRLGDLETAKNHLNGLLGLNQFKEGSEAYQKRQDEIAARLYRLDQYRQMINEGVNGLSNLAIFRNDKRGRINRIMERLDEEAPLTATSKEQFDKNKNALANTVNRNNDLEGKEITESPDLENGVEEEYVGAVDKDPFLKFFFMDTNTSGPEALRGIYDYKIQQAEEAGNEVRAEELRKLQIDDFMDTLKIADFTESPLTPSFDFDMLRNDGEHDPSLAKDDGKSGLPSRTFVGPLTFVFNTNGSTLRPTDILNEKYCTTAFCEQNEMIKQGVPPSKVQTTNQLLDKSAAEATGRQEGEFSYSSDPVYRMGDSVNADYENNKYYGYLKAYHGKTVDDWIKERKKVKEREYRKMEEGSQIINFVKTFDLKYVLMNDNPESRLKGIDHKCAQNIDLSEDRKAIKSCFKDITDGEDVLSKNSLLKMLNERQYNFPYPNTSMLSKSKTIKDNFKRTEAEIKEQDIMDIMRHGWRNTNEIDPATSRLLMTRMCFVLTQNLFGSDFYQRENRFIEPHYRERRTQERAQFAMGEVEALCQRYVNNIYGYTGAKGWWNGGKKKHAQANEDGTPIKHKYSPIVMERKVRAYNTTDRYVYRGGKSLNINVNAGFTLSSSNGIKVSTSASYKPWDWVKDTVGSFPIVGGIMKAVFNGFGISRSNARDESAGRTQGTNVTAGTFLVNQQATFDIEIGEYERCMVVRFHPAFLKDAFTILDEYEESRTMMPELGRYRKDGEPRSFKYFDEDMVEKQGLLICSGKREDKCLPVKEKYYYFTQHFTEGDMLDTADLHNHPWLLQMRGYRDFQVFTASIGAREVEYIDGNNWLKETMGRTLNDAATFKMNGSHVENRAPELRIIDQSSEIDWPLKELSKTYFEVLPTFPGLYTYMDETGEHVEEWPYRNTNPGRSFKQCEP